MHEDLPRVVRHHVELLAGGADRRRRRPDNGVRVFEFGENYYMPEEADIDDELHRFYRRRLEEFVDRVMNSQLPVCFDPIAT